MRTELHAEVSNLLDANLNEVRVHENMDDFFCINRGDVVALDDRHYVVSGTAREGGFGIDEEPKHWVKYAYDLTTGERKIIKLAFLEQFDLKYGDRAIRRFRSPSKERRTLEYVKGHQHFMQGFTVTAEDDKEVRVIDYIKGKTLFDKMQGHRGSHEAYFHEAFPVLVKLLLPALEALDYLHKLGMRHGDVRSDHLILDKQSGRLRWIDFDYDFIFDESPLALDLLGIGNILSELVGQGEKTIHNLRSDPNFTEAIKSLQPEDFSVVESGTLMNWKKLYPYIPDKLNQILMHFAAGSEWYYESVGEIVEDLREAIELIPEENIRRLMN